MLRPDDFPPQFPPCMTVLAIQFCRFFFSGREKFILVAHDLGGCIAWNFVRKHHEMLQSYIILNAPYTPTFLWIVFSNAKQFFKSWYVVWEGYLHFYALWVGSLWLCLSRNSSVVGITATATSLVNLLAPSILYIGQAFRHSPENAFYIFNQQIYFIIWYLLDRASLI